MKTMFGLKHYVPILKWKRAEQNALGALTEKQKQNITPAIQFVMPKPDSSVNPEKQLDSVIDKFREKMPQLAPQILKLWGSSPVFVDISLLYTTALKVACLDALTASAHHLGLHLISVLAPERRCGAQEINSLLGKKVFQRNLSEAYPS